MTSKTFRDKVEAICKAYNEGRITECESMSQVYSLALLFTVSQGKAPASG